MSSPARHCVCSTQHNRLIPRHNVFMTDLRIVLCVLIDPSPTEQSTKHWYMTDNNPDHHRKDWTPLPCHGGLIHVRTLGRPDAAEGQAKTCQRRIFSAHISRTATPFSNQSSRRRLVTSRKTRRTGRKNSLAPPKRLRSSDRISPRDHRSNSGLASCRSLFQVQHATENKVH